MNLLSERISWRLEDPSMLSECITGDLLVLCTLMVDYYWVVRLGREFHSS